MEQPDDATADLAGVRSSHADILRRDAPRSGTSAIWNELKRQTTFSILQQHADDFPVVILLSAEGVIVSRRFSL